MAVVLTSPRQFHQSAVTCCGKITETGAAGLKGVSGKDGILGPVDDVIVISDYNVLSKLYKSKYHVDHKHRMRATLAGEKVDRIVVSTWGHDFLREWTAEDLAQHTIERQRKFDYDFIKLNPRWSQADYHTRNYIRWIRKRLKGQR